MNLKQLNWVWGKLTKNKKFDEQPKKYKRRLKSGDQSFHIKCVFQKVLDEWMKNQNFFLKFLPCKRGYNPLFLLSKIQSLQLQVLCFMRTDREGDITN